MLQIRKPLDDRFAAAAARQLAVRPPAGTPPSAGPSAAARPGEPVAESWIWELEATAAAAEWGPWLSRRRRGLAGSPLPAGGLRRLHALWAAASLASLLAGVAADEGVNK